MILLSQNKNFSLHRTTACMRLRLFTKASAQIATQLLIHANVMPKSPPPVAPFRHNGFGNNSGSARRSLTLATSHNTEYAKLPFGISPLRSEIPPATSLIPKPLAEIGLFLSNHLSYNSLIH